MKATLRKMYFKAMESITMQMEVYIKEIGIKDRKKDQVSIYLMMDLSSKETSIMINSLNDIIFSN